MYLAILVALCAATFGSSEPPTIKWSLGAVMRTRKTEMHFYPIGTDKLDLLPSYGDISENDVKNKKWQINQVKVGIGNGMFPVCPLVGEIPESGRLRVVVIGKTIHPGSSVTDLEGSAEMSLSSPSSDNAFECELHVESYDSCEDNKSFSDRLGDSFRQRKSKDADIARITEVDVQSDVQIHVLLIEIEVAQETGFFFPNRTPSKRQKQSAPKSPPSRGSVIADHSESSAEPEFASLKSPPKRRSLMPRSAEPETASPKSQRRWTSFLPSFALNASFAEPGGAPPKPPRSRQFATACSEQSCAEPPEPASPSGESATTCSEQSCAAPEGPTPKAPPRRRSLSVKKRSAEPGGAPPKPPRSRESATTCSEQSCAGAEGEASKPSPSGESATTCSEESCAAPEGTTPKAPPRRRSLSVKKRSAEPGGTPPKAARRRSFLVRRKSAAEGQVAPPSGKKGSLAIGVIGEMDEAPGRPSPVSRNLQHDLVKPAGLNAVDGAKPASEKDLSNPSLNETNEDRLNPFLNDDSLNPFLNEDRLNPFLNDDSLNPFLNDDSLNRFVKDVEDGTLDQKLSFASRKQDIRSRRVGAPLTATCDADQGAKERKSMGKRFKGFKRSTSKRVSKIGSNIRKLGCTNPNFS